MYLPFTFCSNYLLHVFVMGIIVFLSCTGLGFEALPHRKSGLLMCVLFLCVFLFVFRFVAVVVSLSLLLLAFFCRALFPPFPHFLGSLGSETADQGPRRDRWLRRPYAIHVYGPAPVGPWSVFNASLLRRVQLEQAPVGGWNRIKPTTLTTTTTTTIIITTTIAATTTTTR